MCVSLIETLKYYEPIAEWATCLFVAYEVLKVREHNRDATSATRRRYWPWVLAGVAATVIAWGPIVLPYAIAPQLMSGTADVPAGAFETTVNIPASLPYTVHKLTPDWEAGGVFLQKKESGHFSLQFNRAAPQGGGELEWEVIPRSSSPSVATIEGASVAPPQPKSQLQQFVDGGTPDQTAMNDFRGLVKGPNTKCLVNIIATEQSHDIAERLVGVIQGRCDVMPHGPSGSTTWIGMPTDYALDDGFTIRAHPDNAPAEALRLTLKDSLGVIVRYAVLPDNDSRQDILLEIGNIPDRFSR